MAKEAIVHYMNEGTLKSVCPYGDIDENISKLNKSYWNNVKKIENSELSTKLKNSLLRTYEYIKNHSRKFGVFYEKNATTSKALGFSRRQTIHEHVKALVALGVVYTIPTKRKDCKQAPNIVVITPVEEVMQEVVQAVEVAPEADRTQEEVVERTQGNEESVHQYTLSLSSSLNPLKSLNRTYTSNNLDIVRELEINEPDVDFVPDYVGNEFKSLVARYFPTSKAIRTLWDKANHVAVKLGFLGAKEEYAIEAFKRTVNAIKDNRIKNGLSFDSICGFYYGALKYIHPTATIAVKTGSVQTFENVVKGTTEPSLADILSYDFIGEGA